MTRGGNVMILNKLLAHRYVKLRNHKISLNKISTAY